MVNVPERDAIRHANRYQDFLTTLRNKINIRGMGGIVTLDKSSQEALGRATNDLTRRPTLGYPPDNENLQTLAVALGRSGDVLWALSLVQNLTTITEWDLKDDEHGGDPQKFLGDTHHKGLGDRTRYDTF